VERVPSGHLDLELVTRFVDVATDALGAAREEIDALNVYPVPDGDTGTNMFLTVSAAREALREAAADSDEVASAMQRFTRGALLGARGNSGVILSQMLGAFVLRLVEAPAGERNARSVAEAMRAATDASYAAVGRPVEGTILTVASAAAAAADVAAGPDRARARDVFAAAAKAARQALARTPEQLPILKDAGVVDAGGRGLSVVLDAAETVLTGRHREPEPHPIPQLTLGSGHDLPADGPAYEVMYLLDADAPAIPPLRQALDALGDSLVVVGQQGLWNVHVHVDDVGAAIEAGLEAGRPHRIRVTHFADQLAARPAALVSTGRAVVAVAAGDGLSRIFAGAGAVVVPGGPGQRPSAGMILDAVTGSGSHEVVVLPNDQDSVRVAEIAARTAESDHGLRVSVIPTQAQVQGLAALAVHEPGRGFDADVLAMTSTALSVRHGAVTVAAKDAMTMAGRVQEGDVLGVIGGDFALIGSDLGEVAVATLERLLGAGGELVTVVTGSDHPPGLAESCRTHVEAHHPGVDVVVYEGGQPRYPLLLSVE